MNPLCLLTKGRTFKDMADRPGAYKLLAKGSVPKFSAGKRPPASLADSTPQTAQTSFIEQPPMAVNAAIIEARASVAPPVGTVKPFQPVVPQSPFAPAAKTSGIASARGAWQPTVSYCKGLVQRFVFGRKGRPVHGATVQAELDLEKVTVMKNDLNEDAMEVVLVERKVGTGEKPLARLSKMEMTGEAWNRLTAPFRKRSSQNAFSSKAETKASPELSAQV
jgi:hypothetical protein